MFYPRVLSLIMLVCGLALSYLFTNFISGTTDHKFGFTNWVVGLSLLVLIGVTVLGFHGTIASFGLEQNDCHLRFRSNFLGRMLERIKNFFALKWCGLDVNTNGQEKGISYCALTIEFTLASFLAATLTFIASLTIYDAFVDWEKFVGEVGYLFFFAGVFIWVLAFRQRNVYPRLWKFLSTATLIAFIGWFLYGAFLAVQDLFLHGFHLPKFDWDKLFELLSLTMALALVVGTTFGVWWLVTRLPFYSKSCPREELKKETDPTA